MCKGVAQFYLDHALDFPSKSAITTFSEQCASRYSKMKRRLRAAWDTCVDLQKSKALDNRPMSTSTRRSESKLSDSYRRKSITPRETSTSSHVPRSISREASSRFKLDFDFEALNGIFWGRSRGKRLHTSQSLVSWLGIQMKSELKRTRMRTCSWQHLARHRSPRLPVLPSAPEVKSLTAVYCKSVCARECFVAS